MERMAAAEKIMAPTILSFHLINRKLVERKDMQVYFRGER